MLNDMFSFKNDTNFNMGYVKQSLGLISTLIFKKQFLNLEKMNNMSCPVIDTIFFTNSTFKVNILSLDHHREKSKPVPKTLKSSLSDVCKINFSFKDLQNE